MPGRIGSRGYRRNGTVRQRRSIANQIEEERTAANERKRQRMAKMRAEQRAAKLEEARLRVRQSSSFESTCPHWNYEGSMPLLQGSEIQRRSERNVLRCCKLKLPRFEEPPEPLKTLLAGYTAESKRFLSKIRKHNSCFQVISFGAEIVTTQFMPTFKVKGQIYHKAGSLIPLPD
ncbi:unnamed protein product, partial [Onchocerca ochengi]|uniref:IBB domain-containing protein n=1 Tax=Onchocerca ochengi TaxID=42157 RepID=A0A182EXJ5_ONCOC